jgi:hypothetical protein
MNELRNIFLAIGTRLHVPETPLKLWVVLQRALEDESLSDVRELKQEPFSEPRASGA